MLLEIKAKIPDGEHFLVTVNNEQKIINRKNKVACYNISTEGIYHIIIEQKTEESNTTLKYWIIYILTIIIQGLFYILASTILFIDFLDDSEKWYEHTKLYYIKSEFDIYVCSDKNIYFRVVSGKYNKLTETYTKPNIQIKSENNDITVKSSFVKDIINIKNEFCNYVRMIIAVISTVFLFSILFMFIMINNSLILGICAFVSLLCLIIGIFLPLSQYRKFKEITQEIA